jgi:hypothetical protein
LSSVAESVVRARELGDLRGLFGGIVGIIVSISAGFIWKAISPVSVYMLLVAATIVAGAVLTTMPETLKMKREI